MNVPRREWLPEALLLIALTVAVTILFAATPLDIEAARFFYRAQGPDHWPFASELPWSTLYQLAPPITASLIVIGLMALLIGRLRRSRTWLVHGTFLLLTVVVGPGLITNAMFKDHWERPRPRDIVEFAGPLHYASAPLRGEGGASFPCGHCSVAFLYAAGWWVWKGRRRAWAHASLAFGAISGLALGLGRMAAGGHFLSDVVWSALFAWGTAHILYYHVLRIPAAEAHQPVVPEWPTLRHRWQRIVTALAALAAAGVLLALFVTPHGRAFATSLDLSSFTPSPRVFEVSAPTANITLVIVDTPPSQIVIQGELHGFAVPGSTLDTSVDFETAQEAPTLRFRIRESGWITDLDASATLNVPAEGLEMIAVRLQHGNIRVADTTAERVLEHGRLRLDLSTAEGTSAVESSRKEPFTVGPGL